MQGSALPQTASSGDLATRYTAVRALSEALVAPLSDADATIQSMADASPAKWHVAHTTWFFETFLLRDHLPGYRLFDARWPFLFNSYYEAEGPRHARAARGLITRPSLDEALAYRAHVDAAMSALCDREDCADLIALGLSHEQQHQELLLTDIKHAFWMNPLGPAYCDVSSRPSDGWDLGRLQGNADQTCDLAERGSGLRREAGWHEHPGGIARIGHDGSTHPATFAFDNEGPAHRVLLEPFALCDTLVTNGAWDAFVADGGYRDAALWLSDGWAWVRADEVTAPLYWREDEHFTLAGWRPRDPDAPVTHVSYYEADAFACWAAAQWSGARLPTEFEWEAIGQAHDPAAGNQLDGLEYGAPAPAGSCPSSSSSGLFGDCWQFTRSAYLPYPRFRPCAGAVGEYNGKFMSGQFVLRGASCATPRGHSRPSYRNFFYPHQRWQFTGLRLAKDL